MLVGKKNWIKYRGIIEKNHLLLSDPESSETSNEKEVMRIELKPDIQFLLEPRRNHDYRFKMITSPSTHYFLKCSTAFEREKWIQSLSLASQSVSQNTCARCCRKYSGMNPLGTEKESTTTDVADGEMAADPTSETDDVFYAGNLDSEEAIMLVNTANHSGARESSINLVQENRGTACLYEIASLCKRFGGSSRGILGYRCLH